MRSRLEAAEAALVSKQSELKDVTAQLLDKSKQVSGCQSVNHLSVDMSREYCIAW